MVDICFHTLCHFTWSHGISRPNDYSIFLCWQTDKAVKQQKLLQEYMRKPMGFDAVGSQTSGKLGW